MGVPSTDRGHVDGSRGFIHDEDTGLPHEGPGQAEQLHAGPQRAGRLSVGFSTLQSPRGQLGPRVPSRSCGRTHQCIRKEKTVTRTLV